MKMLNANEVQQVSGGDALSDRDFEEWLREVEAAARRNNFYVPIRDF
jgi:gluconate kinase